MGAHKNVVKCEMEMRPAQPHRPLRMKTGRRSELRSCAHRTTAAPEGGGDLTKIQQ